MSTRIVSVGEATVTIRNETRRAALYRARYLKALEKEHPEVRDMPPLWYLSDADMETKKVWESADQFATILSRIVSVENPPVRLPQLMGEVLGHDDALTAYDHYLDDESGFWDALWDAVYEMNEPTGNDELQPMSETALKDAEQNDPNSSTGGESSSAPSGTESENEPAKPS